MGDLQLNLASISLFRNFGRATIFLSAMLFATGCTLSDEDKKSQSLAQCEIDAYGPIGLSYRANYNLNDGREELKLADIHYRNFMDICMKAKGYDFQMLDENCSEPKDGKYLGASYEACYK